MSRRYEQARTQNIGGFYPRAQFRYCDEARAGQPKVGMVPPIRIERTTYGLGNRCSIQLSYGGVV